MELSMLEAVRGANSAASAAGLASGHSVAADSDGNPTNNALRGTEGFFQALERRGNIWTGLADEMRNLNSDGVPQPGHTFQSTSNPASGGYSYWLCPDVGANGAAFLIDNLGFVIERFICP